MYSKVLFLAVDTVTLVVSRYDNVHTHAHSTQKKNNQPDLAVTFRFNSEGGTRINTSISDHANSILTIETSGGRG